MLSSYVQIQARESKFFSKIFHLGARISPDEVPTPTPAPAPAPEPANSESQDPYYGLYGQGSGYESGKETSKNEGYYGNTENSNEFNSMGEFQESQEEYVP
ncbi:hypothetical protein QQP08_006246 [Theobroma cacao]|nr:hypothetical protein QQP08_006246 [Theobroma cacao]